MKKKLYFLFLKHFVAIEDNFVGADASIFASDCKENDIRPYISNGKKKNALAQQCLNINEPLLDAICYTVQIMFYGLV